MSFIFNEEAVTVARDLNRQYRSGLGLHQMGDHLAALQPEAVMDPMTSIGVLESPLVLAIMGARDPFEGMSLAASMRMMPGAQMQDIIAEIVKLLAEVSRHEMVQESCDIAARSDFAPKIISSLREKAVVRLDTVRQQTMATLIDRIRQLSDGKVVEEPFIDELFNFAARCDLRTEIYRNMIVKILLSDRIRARVKLMVIDRLHLLPMQVRLEVVNKVNALADSTDSTFVKHEIEFALREKGLQMPGIAGPRAVPALPINAKSGAKTPQKPYVAWHKVLLSDKYANLQGKC